MMFSKQALVDLIEGEVDLVEIRQVLAVADEDREIQRIELSGIVQQGSEPLEILPRLFRHVPWGCEFHCAPNKKARPMAFCHQSGFVLYEWPMLIQVFYFL